MHNFWEKTLKTIGRAVLLFLVLALFFWFSPLKTAFRGDYPGLLNELKAVFSRQPAPSEEPEIKPLELLNPVSKKYSWQYKNQTYEIDLTLFQSVYDAYREKTKIYSYRGELSPTWAEEYFAMFVTPLSQDQSIRELTEAIEKEAAEHKLTDDQTIELVMAFVQSIPYDDAKARLVLSGDQTALPRYPYEVLYDDAGICSGKSFLAYAMVRELGYGVAFFEYETDKHIAIGIQCSREHSTYGSGYCYAETTAPNNKIGIIPSFDAVNNSAEQESELEYFSEDEIGSQTKNLGQGKIYLTTEGREYRGIAATIADQKEMERLKVEIDALRKELKTVKQQISFSEKAITELRKKMEGLQDDGKYKEYNKLVSKYNDLVADYKKYIKNYNAEVKSYNQKVDRYNTLSRNF